MIDDMIKEVKEVLNLPYRSAAIILLSYYGWNKEKLVSTYLDTGGEKIRKEAGLLYLKLKKNQTKKVILVKFVWMKFLLLRLML